MNSPKVLTSTSKPPPFVARWRLARGAVLAANAKNRVLINDKVWLDPLVTCFDKAAGGFAYSSLILSVIDPLAGIRFSVHIRRGLIAAF